MSLLPSLGSTQPRRLNHGVLPHPFRPLPRSRNPVVPCRNFVPSSRRAFRQANRAGLHFETLSNRAVAIGPLGRAFPVTSFDRVSWSYRLRSASLCSKGSSANTTALFPSRCAAPFVLSCSALLLERSKNRRSLPLSGKEREKGTDEKGGNPLPAIGTGQFSRLDRFPPSATRICRRRHSCAEPCSQHLVSLTPCLFVSWL